jgi:alpha-tubulin suppressor-like RCC1 family protein
MIFPILSIACASLLVAPFLPAAEVTAIFDDAATVPVTAASYTAAGNTVEISLGFVPPTGTDLTIVTNTGTTFIDGSFDNLAHGQLVRLAYNGIVYSFAANYYGGSGNDLVLQWAHNRLSSWGRNTEGQLGNDSTTHALVPVAVDDTGVLKGKTILSGTTGFGQSLVIGSDGTLASWGTGRLGVPDLFVSKVPVAVDASGALAGKTVIVVAVGYNHSLALCRDGRLVAWGLNNEGQLGTGDKTASSEPVPVNQEGILAGKDIVAIRAGSSFSVALCSDGTLATWGGNAFGKLGNGGAVGSLLPVLVDTSGVLAGKMPVEIACGSSHVLVRCADGSLVSWGNNFYGQLGNTSTTDSNAPVLVERSGALQSRTVVSLSAGSSMSFAVCSDGSYATWGESYFAGDPKILTPVSRSIVNKTVAIANGGYNFVRVLLTDGGFFTMGSNENGQLGNDTTVRSFDLVPVNRGIIKPGERFAGVLSGPTSYHSLALIASPVGAITDTREATSIVDSGAVLEGTVNANGTNASVTFQYGLTVNYGSTVAATPSSLTGNTVTAVSAAVSGLLPGNTYHYRVSAADASGTAFGPDRTFTTTEFATLAGLSLDSGQLVPGFSPQLDAYETVVPFSTAALQVTAQATSPAATVQVQAAPATPGSASVAVPLAVGTNAVNVVVRSEDGINTKTYRITVTRLPQAFTFNSASDVPVSVGDFEATGLTASFVLNFLPTPGTRLTVVDNRGSGPIRGNFSNLAQGQIVKLAFGGIYYPFAADYSGGTGNDLVLHWANVRLIGWGIDSSNQLGTAATEPASSRKLPVPVDMTGVLAGRTVIAVSTGMDQTIALCADGQLVKWGIGSPKPSWVNADGALSGKTPVAVASGEKHVLVLCSDGSLVTWGSNVYSQLGTGNSQNSDTPVAVVQSGVLLGKTPIAIAAGTYHNLVLCSDGTLVAWGNNNFGMLGDNTNVRPLVPVRVKADGALAGKTVITIAAGGGHSLALCADGSLAAWGDNSKGQLGIGSTTSSRVPVLVDRSGVLAGKTIVGIGAGQSQNLLRCSDGSLFSWGENTEGQLGNSSKTQSSVPVAVVQSGVLAGKTVVSITAGLRHFLAHCSDGTLASWGANTFGQLGNNSQTSSSVPVRVDTTEIKSSERLMMTSSGPNSFYNIALVARPAPATATTLAATAVQPASAVLRGSVNAADATATVKFEYGPTTGYGSSINASPATVSGRSTTSVYANINGLVAGTTYHFRIVATNANGISYGDDRTFTAGLPPEFSGYTVKTPFGKPVSIPITKILARATDPEGTALTVATVATGSAYGGTVAMSGQSVFYTPPAGYSVSDNFAVTIADADGATVSGLVTVIIGPGPTSGGPTLNPPQLTMLAEGKMEIRFQGIPGRSYEIQRSTNLSRWTTIATHRASPTGGIQFTDDNPPQPSAFYRLALP